jgi:hypothetical protein
MKLLEGRVHLPGGMSNRADLPVDPETGLVDSIAYCAQEAWLVNDTVFSKQSHEQGRLSRSSRTNNDVKLANKEFDVDIDQATAGTPAKIGLEKATLSWNSSNADPKDTGSTNGLVQVLIHTV